MLLLAYDGSDHAKEAIAAASRLMPDAEAVVLTTWEPYAGTLARTGAGSVAAMSSAAFPDLDQQMREHAEATAAAGAEFATNLGLRATPRAAPTNGAAASLILQIADAIDADAIVVGTRGNGWAKSLMLGSTSNAVLHHATRPVIVVPSSEPAA